MANSSFAQEPVIVQSALNTDDGAKEKSRQKRSTGDSPPSLRKKKKKKSKHHRHHQEHQSRRVTDETFQFTGNEEYYVDKKREHGFMHVLTLNRPACPKYRIHVKSLGKIRHHHQNTHQRTTIKRYYVKSHKSKITMEGGDVHANSPLSEQEFIDGNRLFNRRLGEQPDDIETWCEFVRHQDRTHMRSAKRLIVEKKLDILEKAIRENLGNEQLYRLFVAIVTDAYPSFEVSKLLDKLLAKDSTNLTLWQAQIMATQGSMARCIVPDVLKLYERCMKVMSKKSRYDETMLSKFS